MPKRLDLTGQKFNKLTCIQFVKMNNRGDSVFSFQCDCGNIVETTGKAVHLGHTKSCGCVKRKNIIGQKFNRLTCIGFVNQSDKGISVFKFLCDCGNIIESVGSDVKRNRTKSCGCLNTEQSLINSRSENNKWTYGSIRMRSGYEIFYASILDGNKINWEYEPETFKLGNGIRYTPDFYLPKTDTWVEIKGRITDENRRKMSLFRKITGNTLKVYFLKDLEKLAGKSYKSFMKENKEYYF